MIKIKKLIYLLSFLKKLLNINNINSSFKIFFYSILKQNTRYPNYLLKFEKEVSNYFKSKFALSFSNGTTACTALLYSIGVKKNSKIIISKLTFPSVISSILRIGALPIYLDFDKNFQIKGDVNREKILSSDFFLITHAYGLPQNIDNIKSILNLNKKLILIEDISHAQGAKTNSLMVGTLGKGSFMSMQGDKAINAGEGGIVLTNNENVYINGDGSTSRDFCYVDNAVQANILAATTKDIDALNQIYNVALGDRTSLKDLHQIIYKEIKKYKNISNISPKYRDFRDGDVLHSQADISKAKKLLGYRPTHKIRNGIQASISWYLENNQ